MTIVGTGPTLRGSWRSRLSSWWWSKAWLAGLEGLRGVVGCMPLGRRVDRRFRVRRGRGRCVSCSRGSSVS